MLQKIGMEFHAAKTDSSDRVGNRHIQILALSQHILLMWQRNRANFKMQISRHAFLDSARLS